MKNLVVFLTTLILAPLSMLYAGWVFHVVWELLVVTTLGLPSVPILASIGILILAGLAAPTPDTNEKDTTEQIGRFLAIAVIKPTFALAFAALFSLFI